MRFNSAIGILAIAGLLFSGCSKPEPDTPTPSPGPSTVAVTGISVGSASLSLTEGGSATISYTVTPSNATNTGVSFKSSDASVAMVDSNGKVTAGKPGTATITVTTADGGKTATCTVTVTAKTVAVTGISMADGSKEVTLEVGGTAKLEVKIEPSNASNKGVTFKSSDTSVATVDDNGNVKAIKAGTATITATTKDGSKTATCKVTVNATGVAVTGVSLNKSTLSLGEGDTFQLVPTIKPDNASNKEVTWKSSNTAVATVSDDGLVTAVKAGTTTVSCTTKDGNKKANCSVTVKAPVAVTGVKLDKTTLTVEIGTPQKLTATVSPSNATNKEVEWKSSNTSVATVAEDGTVTGIKAGTATITCTSKADNTKKATCSVTVKGATVAVTGVTLNKSTLSITAGETFKLVPTVKPDNASNKEVEWKSSNTSVATVAEDGTVTGVKAGTATITCTTKDGSKKATCSVTVKASTVAVTGVTLDKTTLTVVIGTPQKLTATVKPDNATNKEVTWSSSNTAIATVSSDGTVTGVKAGSATITCTTKDGSKKATCSVTVKAATVAVTGVTLDKTTLTVVIGTPQKLTATVAPSNATNKEVGWQSSNTSVATVASDGTVTGVNAGTATITCTSKADNTKKATCTVTVSPKPQYTVMVPAPDNKAEHRLEITGNRKVYLNMGSGEHTLRLFDKAVNDWVFVSEGMTVSSSNTSVVSASVVTIGSGSNSTQAWRLKGLKAGTADVTLTYATLSVKVSVIVGNYEIHRNKTKVSSVSYELGSDSNNIVRFQLWDKDNSKYVNVSWLGITYSSDESIVKPNGYNEFEYLVQPLKTGSAKITFRDGLGARISDISMTVTAPNLKVYYNNSAVSGTVKYALTGNEIEYVDFKIYDVTNSKFITGTDNLQKVTISSSNTAVASNNAATSDNYRSIKAFKAGTVTLTFSYNGFEFQKVTLTVTPPNLTVYYGSSSVGSSVTYTLRGVEYELVDFRIYDNDAKKFITGTDELQKVTISSSNTAVASNSYATSDNYRSIRAFKAGTATLSFKYKGIEFKTATLTVK